MCRWVIFFQSFKVVWFIKFVLPEISFSGIFDSCAISSDFTLLTLEETTRFYTTSRLKADEWYNFKYRNWFSPHYDLSEMSLNFHMIYELF